MAGRLIARLGWNDTEKKQLAEPRTAKKQMAKRKTIRKQEDSRHAKNGSGGNERASKSKLPSTFGAKHFINRELSWLEFNRRVLEEAQDTTTPLLDRLKFLSIFSSNLDEFFMVRVAGLREQAFQAGAPQDRNADGIPALQQLSKISNVVRDLVAEQYDCFSNNVVPALHQQGIELVRYSQVNKDATVNEFFRDTVFPVLTPMAIDPSHPRHRYHNRALYVIARLRRRVGLGPRTMIGVVQVPLVLPRLVPVGEQSGSHRKFILLEDMIAECLPELFGGFEVETSTTFRVTRDSDIAIIEQESDDMLRLIEERLKARRRSDAVRVEISHDADLSLIDTIIEQEQVRGGAFEAGNAYTEVYRIKGPIDLTGLSVLVSHPDFSYLRDKPITPEVPRGLRRHGEDLLAAIRRRDILLHHPYDSFDSVVDFVDLAATDPNVLAIKQTVYRTSGDSPIIRSLIAAAEAGKHVTALVELKARFDEQANVAWARQLEHSGANVVFGFMDLKTHCKISMIARQEDDTVRRYVHLATGNYNPTTAKTYTDIGLFTIDNEIAEDVSALFNFLTGYSQGHKWNKLAVAPNDLQNRTIELIEEQTKRAKRGKSSRIFAKLNSLVDPRVIQSLYKASQAGVPIHLLVRGICCLRPGIDGVSENIRVTSIVDRYLEHSRIFVFGEGDRAKVFLSSADWMPRNFYRRVEVMFPIESPQLRRRFLNEILPTYLNDNVKARELQSDGTYVRVKPKDGETYHRCQEELTQKNLDQALQSKARHYRP